MFIYYSHIIWINAADFSSFCIALKWSKFWLFYLHEYTSTKGRTPSKGEHLPTWAGYGNKLLSGEDLSEDEEHADQLLWDCFWQFVQKFFSCANRLLLQPSGWLLSDDHAREEDGCGGPRLAWLHVVCGCGAGRCAANFSETTLDTACVSERHIQSLSTALGDVPAASVTNVHPHKTCNICGIVW